jgi:protein gp37
VNKTSIEWTDATWNPIRARLKGQGPKVHAGTFCTKISPGCTNCYASAINRRFGNGLAYTVPNLEHVEFFVSEKILEEPLKRKKPTRIFVGDMFDLFHEAIPRQLIRQVFEVIHRADWHTFQILTKRAAIMREFLCAWWGARGFDRYVHCGVSVEDQQRADERIPLLLDTPAAVRWLSVEPMLEAIRLDQCAPYVLDGYESNPGVLNAFTAKCHHPLTVKFLPLEAGNPNGIAWVVCGGESGPGARPFNLEWAESLLKQCRAAGVPFFMKQIGSNPTATGNLHGFSSTVFPHTMKDRKGGAMEDWPEHLRVREFPSEKLGG